MHTSATAASVPVDEEGTRCLLAAARSDADEQFAHQHAAEDEPRLFNVLRRFSQLPGVGQIAELVFAQQMSHVRKWGDHAKERALMQRRVEETMVGRRAEEVGWLRSMASMDKIHGYPWIFFCVLSVCFSHCCLIWL